MRQGITAPLQRHSVLIALLDIIAQELLQRQLFVLVGHILRFEPDSVQIVHPVRTHLRKASHLVGYVLLDTMQLPVVQSLVAFVRLEANARNQILHRFHVLLVPTVLQVRLLAQIVLLE